jgi:hypothetical protein
MERYKLAVCSDSTLLDKLLQPLKHTLHYITDYSNIDWWQRALVTVRMLLLKHTPNKKFLLEDDGFLSYIGLRTPLPSPTKPRGEALNLKGWHAKGHMR